MKLHLSYIVDWSTLFKFLFAIIPVGVLAQESPELTFEFNRLHERLADYQPFKADTDKIKGEYLGLLDRFDDPRDIARIYFHLADMYVQSGMTDPASAITYSMKAMEFPLKPYERIKIGHIIGGAMIRQNQGQTGEALAQSRRLIVAPLLEALRFALDSEIPWDVPPEPTSVPLINSTFSNGPWVTSEIRRQQVARQHEIEGMYRVYNEELDRYRDTQQSIFHRNICEDTIISIYTKHPYDTAELRQIATEILGDEAAVERIVSRVRSIASEQASARMSRAKDELVKQMNSDLAHVLNTEEPPISTEDVAPTPSAESQEAVTILPEVTDNRRFNATGIVVVALLLVSSIGLVLKLRR